MLVRSRLAASVIDCRAYNGTQTGSEHGADHAMVRARLRLRMNRFEALQLDVDTFPGDE